MSNSRRSATDAVFFIAFSLSDGTGEIGLWVAIEISLKRFSLSWFDGTDEFGRPPYFPKAVAISMANVADECSTHDKESSKQLFPPVSVRRQPVRCS